ncbi:MULTISPECIES: TRAP transporter small permease [unclassified Roseivivax]|uniref:TRAP transporter small permease n=1 Tax=Roseivivax sp. GX 12232 TaxID=2900547 RepID=UPI001E5EB7B4|nr:TRAP transporter small permease [Roseivivax sp. GX 12232]MCE0507203.1 TRAP transporter small permease [Roseivivax sp. GX 12232]
MQTFWSLFDRVLNALALIAAAILPFVFAAIIYDVTTRSLRMFQINWAVAITEYALLYIAALGTPWLLREKGHVSMEAFRAMLPARVNRVIEVLVILLCVTACLVVAWAAVPVTLQNIGVVDIRANFLTRWLLYAPIVLCFGLSAVQFARFLITRESLYRGIDPDAESL